MCNEWISSGKKDSPAHEDTERAAIQLGEDAVDDGGEGDEEEPGSEDAVVETQEGQDVD